MVLGLLVTAGTILGGAFEKAFKENEELKANIQYIVFAVKKALEPATNAVANVLVGIVNLILKAIQYVAVLIKMLTGKNIFDGATMDAFADSMKSADKSSKGIAKNMKEASKQTTKFDEMNILQDNSSAGGGSGFDAGGFTMPTIDLSNLTNAEAEVQKLIEGWQQLGDDMKQALDTPTSKWTETFGVWGISLKGITRQVYGLYEIINGLMDIVGGVSDIVMGIINGDKEQIERGFIELGDGIWKIIDGVIQGIIGFGEFLYGFNYALVENISKFVREKVKEMWEGIKTKTAEAFDKIKTKFDDFKIKVREFIDSVIGNFRTFGAKIGDAIGNAFKSAINSVLAYVESKINSGINSINKLIKGINSISPIKVGTISTIRLPRLAKGGIINQPGRGVMVGSAIAGERGREGILPLTDSQQMAMLGEAIGKYININATIPVYMGNRMVQREMRKIQAEDDFAFNR